MRTKRFQTPVETENMMSEMRASVAFAESQAIEPIKYTLRGTSNDVKKIVTKVDPLAIHIPAWQRNTDMFRVNDIAQNYDELMFENVKCILNGGQLEVVEGAHRTVAMAKRRMDGQPDATLITVEILKCDDREARELFLMQGIGRKNPTPADVWRANLMNNDKRYVEVKNVCDKNNFGIAYDDNKPENPVGILSSVADYTGAVTRSKALRSPETLDRILKLLTRLGWGASESRCVFNTSLIRSIGSLYAHTNPLNYNRMEDAFVKSLGGVQNYEEKIIPNSYRFYFDVFRREINEYENEILVLKDTYKVA